LARLSTDWANRHFHWGKLIVKWEVFSREKKMYQYDKITISSCLKKELDYNSQKVISELLPFFADEPCR
jgi:hypothetical protein